MKIDTETVINAIGLATKLVLLAKETGVITNIKDEARLQIATTQFIDATEADVKRVSEKLDTAAKLD